MPRDSGSLGVRVGHLARAWEKEGRGRLCDSGPLPGQSHTPVCKQITVSKIFLVAASLSQNAARMMTSQKFLNRQRERKRERVRLTGGSERRR